MKIIIIQGKSPTGEIISFQRSPHFEKGYDLRHVPVVSLFNVRYYISVLTAPFTESKHIGLMSMTMNLTSRVKSGKFGHKGNSDSHTFANCVNQVETAPYEPSHPDFHCLLSKFIFYSNIWNMKQTRSLSEFSCLSEYTRLYPTLGADSECHIGEFGIKMLFSVHSSILWDSLGLGTKLIWDIFQIEAYEICIESGRKLDKGYWISGEWLFHAGGRFCVKYGV